MAKLTDDIIKQIQELYKELGVYSQVAKRLKVSAASVSKYVKLAQEVEQCEQAEKTEFQGDIKDIKDILKPQNSDEWKKILEWTPEEWAECDKLRKEGVV